MRQGSVDQISERGLHDRMLAVIDISLSGRQLRIGEERMVALYREQPIGVAGIFDAAHHEPDSDVFASPAWT
jgi:hypothetical protein